MYTDNGKDSEYVNGHTRRLKIVSEYDQEIPQLQTADKLMALWRRAKQQSLDTRKTN